ncbi:ralBP1-associated Eps domain-containing protein 2 isoform X2 [Denticeps clupeoides]|uniref:ralBP1-associated Eps domain-containing protein 2 isoform X2 n=1 Tax=Denticeps clupeoides TaxID=299321 RepID=UPI0010A451DC|nr:ralBP1-associated Eps domain-containing protein 2 isoform X2 [Denticeps clupeoides]
MEPGPGPGAAAAGTFIPLSDGEQRRYSGLLTFCQPDSSGRLAASRVADLFRAAQLPPETLHQITDVCGAKRLGYFSAAQFFMALKLLAAAQAGLPVRLESIAADVPLPAFAGLSSDGDPRFSNPVQPGDAPGLPTNSAPLRPAFRPPDGSGAEKQESWSPPRSPPTHRSHMYGGQRNGTEAFGGYESTQHTRPDASTPHYGPRAPQEQTTVNQVQVLDGPEERGMDDYTDDPWRITEEQLEYYTHQFRSLQPDLGALILGTVAKNFLTKSKLPIHELSHIWELSDMDQDGALTFPEFCTAFHLIVARKNGYPLPETLPLTLRPALTKHGEVTTEMPEIAQPLIVFEESSQQEKKLVDFQADLIDEAREACHDPKRVPASGHEDVPPVSTSALKPDPPDEVDPNVKSKTRPRSYSSTSIDDAMKKAEEPPTPPPRPQKSHSRASSLDLNKLFQQSSQGVKSTWLPLPPALPPRPPATQVPHFLPAADRSSQKAAQQPNFADFSRFRQEEEVHSGNQTPHHKPSLSTEDAETPKMGHTPQKPIRRKYCPDSQSLDATPPFSVTYSPGGSMSKPAPRLPPRQKRDIQTAIRKNRESKAVLTRLNSELQQQFKAVHQERKTLEAQLEILRPMAST